jgi:hypothetical protein
MHELAAHLSMLGLMAVLTAQPKIGRLDWTYYLPLPASNVVFEIHSTTNLLKTPFTLYATTNRPPAFLLETNAVRFFRVRAIEGGFPSDWAK